MPDDPEISISIPELGEVEVGDSVTVTITINNLSDLKVKDIKVTHDIVDVNLFGVIPDWLSGGESFEMELTWTPKEWNPDGMTGMIKVTAKQVSR